MVKIVSLSFLLILFVFQAFAAELRMDRSVCQYVIKHIPDADVTYRPGEDVEGRKVAPADLNPSPINKTIEHEIAIKLFNNTAQVFGLPAPQLPQPGPPGETPTTVPLVETETDIGYITLKNGEAYLNGHPLSGDQQDALAVLCKQHEKR